METVVFIFVGLFLGMLFPIQASISARLAAYSKSPLVGSFIAFLFGSLILLTLMLITRPIFFSQIPNYLGLPWYILTGGGVTGVLFNVILFKKIGASITTMVTLTGQMLMGLMIDHFTLLGSPRTEITFSRSIGAVIMLIGVLVASSTKKNLKKIVKIGSVGFLLEQWQGFYLHYNKS